MFKIPVDISELGEDVSTLRLNAHSNLGCAYGMSLGQVKCSEEPEGCELDLYRDALIDGLNGFIDDIECELKGDYSC